MFNDALKSKVEIVRVSAEIKNGDQITSKMITTVEVGGYNLPSNVAYNAEDVVGKYANTDLYKGDYVLESMLSDTPQLKNEYLNKLDGTNRAISVTIKSFAAGLSGKLERGDIVSLIASDVAAVELFVSLRYLADYVIVDCAAVFEADPASFVAIEIADQVLRLGTANLKGISYYQTHTPMLADSRYDTGRFQTAIGCLKVGQDWESVSGQYGGEDYVLPYVAELEQQDNERTLFQPLTAPESVPYHTELSRILAGLFAIQTTAAVKHKARGKAAGQTVSAPKEKPGKAKGGFKLPFPSRNRGEF